MTCGCSKIEKIVLASVLLLIVPWWLNLVSVGSSARKLKPWLSPQIDQKGVERVLIVPDEMKALDLVSGEVSAPPKNLRYAVTLGFNQYHPAPNVRTYSTAPAKHTKLVLQSSVEQLIEKLEQV